MSKKIENGNRKEKAKHEVKVLPTKCSEVKAKIDCWYYTDGSVRLSGYLVDAETGVRHDSDFKASTKANSQNQMSEKMQFLVGRITEEYQKTVKQEASEKLSNKPFSRAYESLTDEERYDLCPGTCRVVSTKLQALGFFEHTMLPLLDTIGLNIDAVDCANILKAIMQAEKNNGHLVGSPEAVVVKVVQHAKDFNFLYSRLRDLCPQYGLPDIVLHIPSATNITGF